MCIVYNPNRMLQTTNAEEKLQRYMDNVKKANRKYIETHREIINEKKRHYYHAKFAGNEEYLQKRRDYAKAYYLKKKENQQTDLNV